MFRHGCDVLTLGDHVWDQKELEAYLDQTDRVIRPANFPNGVPGKGYCVHEAHNGIKIAVVNLIGRVFMKHLVDSPFDRLEKILQEIKKETSVIIVDFHAETTSEKMTIGHLSDGKVSAVVGTHTHIQTCDEKVLPKGTAYITDLGMSGPYDSEIGQNKEAIIKRFLTSMPFRFQVAKDDVELHGVVIDIDEKSGKARSIQRIGQEYRPSHSKAETS